MKQGRLTIGVIGQQVSGIAIAQALSQAGHMVVAVTSDPLDTDNDLEVLLPLAKRLSDEEIIAKAELVLLAVEASEIVSRISGLEQHFRAGQLVVHLAAEFDHEILQPLVPKGVIPLAIHPAMSFTGTSLDLNRIKESFFAVSAQSLLFLLPKRWLSRWAVSRLL
jgi:predicted short-subunit dehydrogenase-like oxidoreductase (DUF2520 family)